MKISDLIKNKKLSLSFEFFPPKSPELENILFETIESLKNENAEFSSVTFGAGGSMAGKTLEWTSKIKKSTKMEVMMHLTCVGFTAGKLDEILSEMKNADIENILALRGDLPKDTTNYAKDFTYASDLIKYIKQKGGFCIGCAGYPEQHPEAKSEKEDIEHLKIKVDNGAEFIVTQLFFDNDKFFRFRDNCNKIGVNVPIIAGIMPIVNATQIVKFTQMCNATIPKKLLEKIEGKSESEVIKIGIDYAITQCAQLIDEGVAGLHFYTLNRSLATKSVLKGLGL